MHLITSPRPSCSISWVCHESTISGVLCVSSGELISSCDDIFPPGRCQPSRIPGRYGYQLGACSQFGGGCWSLGPRLPLAFWLWLSCTYFSACSAGEGPICSWLALLWYLLNPLFCEGARLRLRWEPFVGKFSLSLFFSLLLSHSLGCCLMLTPSDCPLDIQARSLAWACSRRLPVQPPLTSGGCECLGYFSAGVVGWRIFCGFVCLFVFSSQLFSPLRFQNSPQIRQWEGLLLFGNFSFMTPSPGWVSVINFYLSFCLSHFVLPPFEENGLSFWVPGVLTSVQTLFCGSCSAFRYSFDEFVGEKVVSPSYSSTILGPPPVSSF